MKEDEKKCMEDEKRRGWWEKAKMMRRRDNDEEGGGLGRREISMRRKGGRITWFGLGGMAKMGMPPYHKKCNLLTKFRLVFVTYIKLILTPTFFPRLLNINLNFKFHDFRKR